MDHMISEHVLKIAQEGFYAKTHRRYRNNEDMVLPGFQRRKNPIMD